jgi:hypothetical protein
MGIDFIRHRHMLPAAIFSPSLNLSMKYLFVLIWRMNTDNLPLIVRLGIEEISTLIGSFRIYASQAWRDIVPLLLFFMVFLLFHSMNNTTFINIGTIIEGRLFVHALCLSPPLTSPKPKPTLRIRV